MQNKAKQNNNSAHQFRLDHSPAHQAFNKNNTIKVNKTGKKIRKSN